MSAPAILNPTTPVINGEPISADNPLPVSVTGVGDVIIIDATEVDGGVAGQFLFINEDGTVGATDAPAGGGLVNNVTEITGSPPGGGILWNNAGVLEVSVDAVLDDDGDMSVSSLTASAPPNTTAAIFNSSSNTTEPHLAVQVVSFLDTEAVGDFGLNIEITTVSPVDHQTYLNIIENGDTILAMYGTSPDTFVQSFLTVGGDLDTDDAFYISGGASDGQGQFGLLGGPYFEMVNATGKATLYGVYPAFGDLDVGVLTADGNITTIDGNITTTNGDITTTTGDVYGNFVRSGTTIKTAADVTWDLGAVAAGVVTPDGFNYVEVTIGGVPVKLIIAA